MADNAVQAEAHIELRLQILVLFDDAAMIQGPIDRHFQLVVDDRLGDQIECAGADRLDGGFYGAVAGHQDDGRVRALLAAMGQDLEAVAVAQAHIDKRQFVMLLAQRGNRLGDAGHGVDGKAQLAQPGRHGL